MSGTVNYPKVIDHLTDVIKELNVPCAEPPPAEATAAERQADAAALLRSLLNTLESHDADARAAAAEHGATEAAKIPAKAAVEALGQFTFGAAKPPKPAGNLDPYRASAKAEKRGPPALA
jgi:hypothetical protein